MNEKLLRLIVILVTALLHVLVIFFLVFDTQVFFQDIPEDARVMRLIDMEEYVPPPPPPPDPEIPRVEEIAETMIETDTAPVQVVVAAGTIITPVSDEFLPAHLVSSTPQFDEDVIASEIFYPPIALRSGIEGRVILDLFVDRNGMVQRITILREEPEGRGFGEAAVRVFTGRQGIPATADGVPVSCRFRYPVVFRIR